MARHPHPTKAALIATAVRLLDEHPAEEITTELVLQQSGISRSSLYHHFEDFNDLIESADVVRFTRYVDYSITTITQAVLETKTRDELRNALANVTRATQGPAMAAIRSQRVSALALASRNARFATKLAVEQERMTEAMADLIREGQARGMLNPSIDPRTASVLVQAYTVGQVVDDFTPTRMSTDAWIFLIDLILDRVFMVD
jgi:AcrR family transcriptional regulator